MSHSRLLDGDRGYRYVHDDSVAQDRLLSLQAWTVLGFVLAYGLHLLVRVFDLPFLSLSELLWNTCVLLIPTPLIHMLARISRVPVDMGVARVSTASEWRAVKSEALRTVFRLNDGQGSHGTMLSSRARSISNPKLLISEKPPGLGNWDNSCYQNSVLQGLSSLHAFTSFLDCALDTIRDQSASTTAALHGLAHELTNSSNNGRRIWTPPKLKSMSSWQQQDAQEYYSRLLEDIEKDLGKTLVKRRANRGLQDAIKDSRIAPEDRQQETHNPLEGLLGQRVTCTECGYSEGVSLLPFNCLTLSLGLGSHFTLQSLLNDYTRTEKIEGVECLACTFRRQRQRLLALLPSSASAAPGSISSIQDKVPTLPVAVQQQIHDRLAGVEKVIEDADYTDDAVKRCNVTKEMKAAGVKSKQVALARAPTALAIHLNRSMFDETTGALSKNSASVSYPYRLTLNRWTLDILAEEGRPHEVQGHATSPAANITSYHPPSAMDPQYVLRSVITHHGRHENGHYVCYRQHPTMSTALTGVENEVCEKLGASQWWRLSDDDVTLSNEEEVLRQGAVFMLFYERIDYSPITDTGYKESCKQDTRTFVPEPDPSPEDTSFPIVAERAGDRSSDSDLAVPRTAVPPLKDVGLDVSVAQVEHQEVDEDTAHSVSDDISTRPHLDHTKSPPALRTSRKMSRNGSVKFMTAMPTVTAQ